MNNFYFTSEKNHLILISLLKKYGIRKVIASPGATNICFVASLQHDPFFQMYSCVDERSAAYMACGLAEESGEPVVISCTGATSSREYMSGLTEAFYRKLPIVTITSSQDNAKVGHLIAQVTDRSVQPNDIVVKSVHLQTVKDSLDEWDCMIKVNKALSALTHHGGGPVHINLTTIYSRDYSIKELPNVRKITRYVTCDNLPTIPTGRVAIFVGSHHRWSGTLTQVVDDFCAQYDAVVLCDHSSNYHGKYRVFSSIVGIQDFYHSELLDIDLLIHIGEVSGGYEAYRFNPKEVWRVDLDGEFRDQFRKLNNVFEMSEEKFFNYYSSKKASRTEYLSQWKSLCNSLYSSIPELPLSNIWIAQQISSKFPADSVVYFAILSTLRSWNLFDVPETVSTFSNTGGFGIDGFLSTIVGASLFKKDRLYFTIVGDLAFFYDMNALGIRHIGPNVRIMVINNGCGMEFKLVNHPGYMFGSDTDTYISAAGHYGNQSRNVVKNYVESLGFEYLSASTKEEFNSQIHKFLDPRICESPLVFEVFTRPEDESIALQTMSELKSDSKLMAKHKVGILLRSVFGK